MNGMVWWWCGICENEGFGCIKYEHEVLLLSGLVGNGFFTGNWIGIELTLLLESRSRIWLGLVGLVIWWMHVKGIT
jgi:hypothetical protein